MDSLFSSMPMRFFIAFVVVFGLIGLTAWLIRRFGQARIGENARGRQPRLAVIEVGPVDGRRRLVLIRRDNVEHLLMIGGPTDIVVEQNIVRGQVAAARPAAYPERQVEPTAWPLQPESVPQPVPPNVAPPALRPARPLAEEPTQWSLEPAPAPMPRQARGDALSGLAAELAARPNGPSDHAPRVAPPVATPTEPAIGGDQNLADVAQRLEAALRQPGAGTPQPRSPAKAAPTPAVNGSGRPQAEAPQVRPEPRATAPASAADDKKAFTSLEEEMASLLGRKG